MDSATTPPPSSRAFSWRLLIPILFARTVLDTGTRALYPFLPFIAANLNVPIESAAEIIQVRNLMGFAAPLFGPLSDRYGRRAVMLAGLGIVSLAALALLFVSPLVVIIATVAVGGLGLMMYIPAQQAFFGDTVPYAQRGRVMAFVEVSWSVAAIVGLPLVGAVTQFFGWRWAFGAIGLLGLIALGLMWVVLPRREGTHQTKAIRWGGAMLDAFGQPVVLGALGATFLLFAANENINIIFGEWMKDSFALDAVALGFVGSAIGGAELAAELFAVAFVDRIGKWRLVVVTLLLGVAVYFLLPWLEASVWLGTAGLVLVFFMFELTVVSMLPILSEISPTARGTVLSLGSASASLGRTLGSVVGPLLLTRIGFGGASVASAFAVAAGLGLWVLLVRERHDGAMAVQP